METNPERKRFTEEDEINFKVDKFLYCARELEQFEKEMIDLCTDMISTHGMSMEDAIDSRKNVDLSEQGIAD